MAKLFTGTSGWAYPTRKPDFYPEKLAQKKFLNHYATELNAVEASFTFRQLVKETTLQNWLAETPEAFRFTIKAHQVITHIRRLKDTGEFVTRFLATIEPLAAVGKLGLGFVSTTAQPQVSHRELLEAFLQTLPKRMQSAFEFRDASWFADSTYDALRQYGAALCVAETESLTTPEIVTADFIYYRFRKPNYPPDERKEMVDRIQGEFERRAGHFWIF